MAGIVHYDSARGELYTAEDPSVPAARWEDLRFTASASNPSGAGTSKASFQAERQTLLFGGSEDEFSAYQVQMPHSWVTGTPIRPHCHWIQTAAGLVLWQLRYMVIPAGQSFPTWPSYTTITTAASNPGEFTYTEDNLHQISVFPEIDLSDYTDETSLMMIMVLGRLGSSGGAEDTMSAQAELLEFDIHYLARTSGSISEFAGSPSQR